jgi:AhpD family alkylhydroperoxidase
LAVILALGASQVRAEKGPSFLSKGLPEEAQPSAIALFAGFSDPRGALPSKVKHRIALGVASQIPCRYCVIAHKTLLEERPGFPEVVAPAVQNPRGQRGGQRDQREEADSRRGVPPERPAQPQIGDGEGERREQRQHEDAAVAHVPIVRSPPLADELRHSMTNVDMVVGRPSTTLASGLVQGLQLRTPMSTYDENRGSSLLGNIWEGTKTGAGAGALFGGVGAIPGAIGGAGLGFLKSIVQKVDEGDDRREFLDHVRMEGGAEYADSKDPDMVAAREEVFYENREGRRESEEGLFGFFNNWVY